MIVLRQQYQLAESARRALLDYLSTLPFEKLHQPVEVIQKQSVCNLLSHVAVTYLSWLNELALNQPLQMTDGTDWHSMADIEYAFVKVNDCVYHFLDSFADPDEMITAYKQRQDKTVSLSVLQLFTHVVTHEFHHKGVVLNMTRQLGFTPVDTDVIRT